VKYLFYVAKAYSISVIASLVKYLDIIESNYAFYISAKVKLNFPKQWDQSRILKDLKDAKRFNPDFVIVPGNFVDYRIPGIKIQIFHGLGVEKPVHYKIRHFFDVYLTSGKYVTDRYLELQNKYKYFDVFETGWIKIDWIMNYPVDSLKTKLNIPTDKKIILYAPTFSSKMQSATELLAIVPKIIKSDEYWLFKFHELMHRDLISSLINVNKNSTQIIMSDDITPYLHISNLLISDTSSVVYEFLALDKPVITYKTISNEDKAFNIIDPNSLRNAIDECLSYPEYLRERRNEAIKHVNPYLDGKICERVVFILEKLNPNDYPKRNKPLNIVRKIQIIYHSIFKKGYLR